MFRNRDMVGVCKVCNVRLVKPGLQCSSTLSKLACCYESFKCINCLVDFNCFRCGITANH